MSESRLYSYENLVVSVDASDSAALVWLEEFLSPAFTRADAQDPACRISLEDDERAYDDAQRRAARSASEPIACFTLDNGPIYLPSWTWSSQERLVFDDDSQVFYRINRGGSRIRILTQGPRPSRRIALMRVVRELVTTHVWAQESHLLVHAAAAAVGNRGLLIAGPKGAGKTSILLHILLHQPGALFVSNDRVVVDLTPPAALRAMPTVTGVKEPMLDLFPDFVRRLRVGNYDARLARGERNGWPGTESRAGLAPAQLCEAAGVAMRRSVPAKALLLPRVSRDDEGIEVTPLTARTAAGALRKHLLGGAAPVVSQVFGVTATDRRGLDPVKLDRLAQAFTEQTRCFECRLGRNAYRPETAARLVDLVLDR